MATTSPRRQRVIEDMTIRRLSPATQQSYVPLLLQLSLRGALATKQCGGLSLWPLHCFAALAMTELIHIFCSIS